MSNLAPVSSEKMALIRTLACVGITDGMIDMAATHVLGEAYAKFCQTGEAIDFHEAVKDGVKLVLFNGGNIGGDGKN